MNPDVYVSIRQIANCRICGVRQDLRCGACFNCTDRVTGEKVSDISHKLWDIQNPSNFWFYSQNGN